MQIEKIDIRKIIPYKNNVKKHPEWQIEQIKESIKQFGFNDPIAINADNQIIEGHGRYFACKELGYDNIDCIRLTNMTDDEERAYILVHNKLTMNTGFDVEKLEYELNALKVENLDMKIYGFEKMENIPEEDPDMSDFLEEKEKPKKIKKCPYCGHEL